MNNNPNTHNQELAALVATNQVGADLPDTQNPCVVVLYLLSITAIANCGGNGTPASAKLRYNLSHLLQDRRTGTRRTAGAPAYPACRGTCHQAWYGVECPFRQQGANAQRRSGATAWLLAKHASHGQDSTWIHTAVQGKPEPCCKTTGTEQKYAGLTGMHGACSCSSATKSTGSTARAAAAALSRLWPLHGWSRYRCLHVLWPSGMCWPWSVALLHETSRCELKC